MISCCLTVSSPFSIVVRNSTHVLIHNIVWSALALPTLKVVLPRLRKGAVVLTDNTISGAEGYKDLLAFLRDPKNGFQNMCLPFTNGFEMSVYMPGSE